MTGTADDCDNGNGILGSYHWNGADESPSLAIIDALAELRGVAPLSLDILYDSIDPDALDRLLQNETDSSVAVEFQRGDYRITVDDGGDITIREADDPEE